MVCGGEIGEMERSLDVDVDRGMFGLWFGACKLLVKSWR